MNRTAMVALVLTTACIVTITPTARAMELPASLLACSSEPQDARRLSCYDREIGQHVQQPIAQQTPPAAPTSPTVSAEEQFGYRGSVAREELDRRAAEIRALEKLEATITQIAKRPHGELVMTLNNGQVWAQKAPDSRARLKVGDRIAIRRGALGSFSLANESGRSTAVTRLQ